MNRHLNGEPLDLALSVRGQRTDFPLDGAGNLVRGFMPVARGEDRTAMSWQVSLAPVFLQGVGSTFAGMPAWQAAPISAGAIDCRLTFGGGGVGFQVVFPWPVNGASFAVSGDNVMVEADPLDTTTVFTQANKPCVVGWLKPDARPTDTSPLVVWRAIGDNVATPILPFARAFYYANTAAGNSAVITFTSALLTLAVIEIPAGTLGPVRIPCPAGAELITVNTTAAPAYLGTELSFT